MGTGTGNSVHLDTVLVTRETMKKTSLCTAVLAAVIATVGSCQASSNAISLKNPYDESSPVTLVGHIVEVFVYGPPGFGEYPKTDSKGGMIVLMLDKPITVRDEQSGKAIETDELQMSGSISGKMSSFRVPGKVAISGRLFFAMTGGQQTQVLISVRKIHQVDPSSIFSGVPKAPGNLRSSGGP